MTVKGLRLFLQWILASIREHWPSWGHFFSDTDKLKTQCHRCGIDNKPVLWNGYLMLMNEEIMSSYLFRPQPHWGETVRDGGQYFPIPKEGWMPYTSISVSWESPSESNFYGSVKHRSLRHCSTWACGRKMHTDSANGVWAVFTERKEKLVWLCGWGTLSQFNVQMLLLLHLYVNKNQCFYFPLS